MSKLNKALQAYTDTSKAIRDFKQSNSEVFDAYDSLLLVQKEAEETLKSLVRDEKRNVFNDEVKVTYTPVIKIWYDGDFIMSKVTPKVKKQLLEDKVVTYNVDKKKFEGLVEKEIISVEIKQEAERSEEQTSRVSIKEQ